MSTSGVSSGSYGRRVTLPGVSRDVEDILLWRDVRVSAGVFVGITALYLLLEWSGLTLLTIISNTLLGLIALAFIWNNVAKFTGKSGVPLPGVVQHGISESHLKSFAESLSVGINKALATTNRLISGQDVILTVKVAAGLYAFGKVGNYFSSLGLLYTLAVLAFTVPKIYELKKDDIDNAVTTASHQGRAHYKNYVEPYVNKIPRASTSTSSASGAPLGGQGTNPNLRSGHQNTDTATSPNFGGGSGQQNTGSGNYSSGQQTPGSGNFGGQGQGNTGSGNFGGGNPNTGYDRGQQGTGNFGGGQQGSGYDRGQQGTGSGNFGGGSGNYNGNQAYNTTRPSNTESDNDFTNVAREAVAGVSSEGKKLS